MRLKKESMNKYLPKHYQYQEDLIIFYDRKVLHFRCNQCGRCCDLRQRDSPTPDDPLAVVLCEQDVKRLAAIDMNALQQRNPKFAPTKNAIGLIRPETIRSTERRELVLVKTDGACPFFNRETKLCEIYQKRPLICRIFPWVLTERDVTPEMEISINPRTPCPNECFKVAPCSPKIIAKVAVRHFQIMAGLNSAEPTWQKFLSQQITMLGSQTDLLKHGSIFMNRLMTEEIDFEEDSSFTCKNGDRILIKRWVVCRDNEIQKLVKEFNITQDNMPEDVIPEKASDLIGAAPIHIFLVSVLLKEEIVGFQLMMRRPDNPKLANFDSFTPQTFLALYIAKIAGDFESMPDYVQKLTKFVIFGTHAIDLADSNDLLDG